MTDFRYANDYDDGLLAELYDQSEVATDDVDLLRRLIGERRPLRILECFSGTGRILVPLAQRGHYLTGIEMARSMNDRAAAKVAALGPEAREGVRLMVGDVLDGGWGTGYDLVVIGANALYELPSAEAQARCIHLASESLVAGGHLFVDNDDYKGDWGEGPFGTEHVVFEGTGADGAYGRETRVSLSFDADDRVLHMQRTWVTVGHDGRERRRVLATRKHPVSAVEVSGWLEQYGFEVLSVFGDRQASPYAADSMRAGFWARWRHPRTAAATGGGTMGHRRPTPVHVA